MFSYQAYFKLQELGSVRSFTSALKIRYLEMLDPLTAVLICSLETAVQPLVFLISVVKILPLDNYKS